MTGPRAYKTASAFRRALEDRLAASARAEGSDLQRLRRQVAFDRLLVRLFAAEPAPWILKGGYALELKLALARTTRDIDLGLCPSHEMPGTAALLDALQDAAARDAGDFFVFLVGEALMDLEGAPYGGTRHPVEARMDGRLFAKFHLDVGGGDVQRAPYEVVAARDWLGFAGIAAGVFPSISREEHFAQKLHAFTMPRGERPNSRVKDLVDLVLLVDSAPMDAARLARDIRDTFARRRSHELPEVLAAPPDFWGPVFVRLAAECGVEPDINAQFAKVRQFVERLMEHEGPERTG